MPQRFLRPGIAESDHWNNCSFEAQSMFVRLLTLVDDFGRYDGRIAILHAHCFALRPDISPQDTATFRCELQSKGLIDVYEVEGKEYLQLLRWQERARSFKSRYPDPLSKPQDSAAERCIPQEKDASLASTSSSLATTSSPAPAPASPPAVLQGGGQSADSSLKISNQEEAKRLICEKILCGRDPARPWSPQAEADLTRLLPVPLHEIETVGWFRALVRDEEIPELKSRRDPITETTLMRFWGDEFTRAAAYRAKRDAAAARLSARRNPPRWREFFYWKHGEQVRLPRDFDELDADLRANYHSEFQVFAAERPLTGASFGNRSN